MNRPSHWILAFLAVFGGLLWATGGVARLLDGMDNRRARPPIAVALNHVPAPAYAEVQGQVVDRLGWPVAAAKVEVLDAEGEAVKTAPAVETDESGRFEIELAGAVHRRLRVRAEGRHDAVEAAGSLDELVIVLQDALPWETERPELRGRSLLAGEGFLKDQDGQAVAGARVYVLPSGATAQSDGNGRFVAPLPTGECRLLAWDDQGRVASSEPFSPSRQQGMVPVPELELAPGATLRGRLVADDGEPLDGLTLVIEGQSGRRVAHSAADGSFAIAGLLPGDCVLTAIPHQGLLGFRATVLIEGDHDLGDARLQLAPQEPLRVQVARKGEDQTLEQLDFVHVVADQGDGLRRAYGMTDREGVVALAGLAADEEIHFEVRDSDLEPLEILAIETEPHRLLVR